MSNDGVSLPGGRSYLAGTTLAFLLLIAGADFTHGLFAQPPVVPSVAEAGDDGIRGDANATGEAGQPVYRNEVVRGQVVWLAEALKDRFGISTVPEAAEQSLAILTSDGELLPLVENLRGRAFRKDERLRDMQLEVWVRRYQKQPFVQILRVFELSDGQRFEVDYWCDVCAIPMYETGPCACCQDHNRIRKRLVPDQTDGPESNSLEFEATPE
jgi:hypothetical protein